MPPRVWLLIFMIVAGLLCEFSLTTILVAWVILMLLSNRAYPGALSPGFFYFLAIRSLVCWYASGSVISTLEVQ